MDVDPNWHEGWFEGDWLDLIALRFPPERAIETVDFLIEHLSLEPGARVLDIGCGHGRHSLELARRGLHVTGIDASPRSLAIARTTAAEEALDVELRELDMRTLDYDGEFDAAISLFTSFGFFDEADNQAVLDGAARALRPGGSFVVDVINPPGLFPVYRDHFWETLDDGTLFLQEHDYDHLSGRNRATWTFVRPDGTRSELRHSVRIYTAPELSTMLQAAGLTVGGAWGGWAGEPLDRAARRLIVQATRT